MINYRQHNLYESGYNPAYNGGISEDEWAVKMQDKFVIPIINQLEQAMKNGCSGEEFTQVMAVVCLMINPKAAMGCDNASQLQSVIYQELRNLFVESKPGLVNQMIRFINSAGLLK